MARLNRGLRTALMFLLVGILLLFYFYWRFEVWFREGSVDIHLYDTYFVTPKWNALFLVSTFLLFLFSMGGMIGSRMKNWIYVTLFVLSGISIGFIICAISPLF